MLPLSLLVILILLEATSGRAIQNWHEISSAGHPRRQPFLDRLLPLQRFPPGHRPFDTACEKTTSKTQHHPSVNLPGTSMVPLEILPHSRTQSPFPPEAPARHRPSTTEHDGRVLAILVLVVLVLLLQSFIAALLLTGYGGPVIGPDNPEAGAGEPQTEEEYEQP